MIYFEAAYQNAFKMPLEPDSETQFANGVTLLVSDTEAASRARHAPFLLSPLLSARSAGLSSRSDSDCDYDSDSDSDSTPTPTLTLTLRRPTLTLSRLRRTLTLHRPTLTMTLRRLILTLTNYLSVGCSLSFVPPDDVCLCCSGQPGIYHEGAPAGRS